LIDISKEDVVAAIQSLGETVNVNIQETEAREVPFQYPFMIVDEGTGTNNKERKENEKNWYPESFATPQTLIVAGNIKCGGDGGGSFQFQGICDDRRRCLEA